MQLEAGNPHGDCFLRDLQIQKKIKICMHPHDVMWNLNVAIYMQTIVFQTPRHKPYPQMVVL
jgi:hypothetical protein